MALDDDDTELLKKWIIKKLEDISDADSDVLADYVLALVTSDDPEPIAKSNSVENLKDFLNDNAQGFVDEVFAAIKTKSFDPSRPVPKPPAPHNQAPRTHGIEQQRLPRDSRKRTYRDWDMEGTSNGVHSTNEPGNRPMKQPRRNGRGFDQRGARQSTTVPGGSWGQQNHQQGFPAMPAFDPNDPWSMFQAMNHMFEFITGSQNGGGKFGNTGTKQRCRDYDERGFCSAGISCPFEHGENPVVVPPSYSEYDPTNTGLPIFGRHGQSRNPGHERGRGSSRRRRQESSKRQADNTPPDPFPTAIVVKDIPDPKFNEESVREYFSEFGDIESVAMHPKTRVSIIKFMNHDAAKSAHDSPKSIFDNRFVQVFWHRERRRGSNKSANSSSPSKLRSREVEMQDIEEVDPAEVAKRVEEAQRKYMETKKLREDADKQRQDLDNKIRAMDSERREITKQLAKRLGQPLSEETEQNGGEESEKTKALREQLAKLEEEAKLLGIDPDAPTANGSDTRPFYGSRGGYRGRGRGRGYFAGYRGRGNATGAVMRLDNRPKTIAVVSSDASIVFPTLEEKLKQFMLFNSLPYTSISKHPDQENAALVSFEQRFEGENTMDISRDGKDLPYIGDVQLSWHKASASNGITNAPKSDVLANDHSTEDDKMQTSTPQETNGYENGRGEEENLDHF